MLILHPLVVREEYQMMVLDHEEVKMEVSKKNNKKKIFSRE
jgi:hypothetical protein